MLFFLNVVFVFSIPLLNIIIVACSELLVFVTFDSALSYLYMEVSKANELQQHMTADSYLVWRERHGEDASMLSANY